MFVMFSSFSLLSSLQRSNDVFVHACGIVDDVVVAGVSSTLGASLFFDGRLLIFFLFLSLHNARSVVCGSLDAFTNTCVLVALEDEACYCCAT